MALATVLPVLEYDQTPLQRPYGTVVVTMPDHLTEALRTNLSGCKTAEQLISEAAQRISFMSQEEVLRRIQSSDPGITLLDVRERDLYLEAHIPGAILIPRGQLELRVNQSLPDPTARIVVYCQFGLPLTPGVYIIRVPRARSSAG